MRLGLVFLVIAFIVLASICESKSTKKPTKKSKDDTKAMKLSHRGKSEVKSKSSREKLVESKKDKIPKKSKKEKVTEKHKDTGKAKSKSKISEKKKALDANLEKEKKMLDKSVELAKKSEGKKETLKQVLPKDCDDIVQQYTNGELIMYEYKIKMKRCLNGQKEEKKNSVPAIDAAMMSNSATPDATTANYYTMQGQAPFQQAQTIDQTQAAFNQDPMANEAAPAQQSYNYYTRSNIPAPPQAFSSQDPSSQWNIPSVDTTTKKDTLPAAPPDDPFANFMNMQSSQNIAPQAPQQRNDIPVPAALPLQIQQRNDIPVPVPAPEETQQRSDIPIIDASYQAPNPQAYPSIQQAYFRDHVRAWSPEDHGMFPENP